MAMNDIMMGNRPSSADGLLELSHITHRYGDTVALNDVSFSVAKGEIFGLLGHNGAGKTTAVRLLNGLIHPVEGTLRVNGLNPVTEGPDVRHQTGVLTETPSLDERLTARQNLRLFARMYNVANKRVAQRVDGLLEQFGLAERGDERVGAFSRGMKQRVALARALLHEPQILFLDEPASGLDPVATRQLHELIQALSRSQGVTIVLCTHNLAEAQQLCRRVAVLQTGRLMALGVPSELAQRLPGAARLLIEVPVADSERVKRLLNEMVAGLVIREEGPFLAISGAEPALAPRLVEILVQQGIALYQLRREEPTLEDVYFALHSNDTPSNDVSSDTPSRDIPSTQTMPGEEVAR
jgi:ABC-2 type transport system ATP-binding protein